MGNSSLCQNQEKENSNVLDVDNLFNLSEIAFQVELALGKAQTMTKSNETIYETNFQTGKVKKFMQIIMVIIIHFQQNIHYKKNSVKK